MNDDVIREILRDRKRARRELQEARSIGVILSIMLITGAMVFLAEFAGLLLSTL